MTDDITKLQRWLDLIAHLVSRRLPVSVQELMESVPAYAEKWRGGDETDRATARRTFERDKRELREIGIPIATVGYTVEFGGRREEGYRLARDDFYLPYLRIASRAAADDSGGEGADAPEVPRDAESPDGAAEAPDAAPEAGDVEGLELDAEEAGMAVDALRRVADVPGFPLRREARSALRKLTFDLAGDELEGTPVLYPDRPDAEQVARRLRALTGALLDRERVTFRYHGIRRDRVTERDVAPWGLFFQHGEWYLVGSDAARDGEVRVFRADRMEAVEGSAGGSGSGAGDPPDGFEIRDYLDREAWELGDEEDVLEAEVHFRFPASLRAARQGRGEHVEEREDGASVRRFRVRQVGPFLRWLLTFRGDAHVLSPPELRRELREVAAEVAAVHAGGGPGGGPADG